MWSPVTNSYDAGRGLELIRSPWGLPPPQHTHRHWLYDTGRDGKGHLWCKYTPQQFWRIVLHLKHALEELPLDLQLLIWKHLDIFHWTNLGQWRDEKMMNFLTISTQSGRVSRPVVSLTHTVSLKGSGFSGCDTYDRGFDGYSESGAEPAVWATKEDRRFIADDDEESSGSDSECEAWNSTEGETDTEAEWDSDATEEEESEEEEEEGPCEEWLKHEEKLQALAAKWGSIEPVACSLLGLGFDQGVIDSWSMDPHTGEKIWRQGLCSYQVVRTAELQYLQMRRDDDIVVLTDGAEIGELAMNHKGEYYIHTGEGPPDG